MQSIDPLPNKHPVNRRHHDDATFGQRAAERMAKIIGSWKFLGIQSFLLSVWILLNSIELFFKPFDPFPFILLNLTLSFQAAYTGPILLIAANRSAERDRQVLEHEADQASQHTVILNKLQEVLDENTRLTRELHDGRTVST